VVCVIVNSIVLLNFIIAILADTYAKLSSQSLGLYYDGIIARIPVYEDDSRYGGLIVGSPPFNIFALLLVPLYAVISDVETIRSINTAYTKIIYLPIALCLTVIFAFFSLLMIPFAYLSALSGKLQMLCR